MRFQLPQFLIISSLHKSYGSRELHTAPYVKTLGGTSLYVHGSLVGAGATLFQQIPQCCYEMCIPSSSQNPLLLILVYYPLFYSVNTERHAFSLWRVCGHGCSCWSPQNPQTTSHHRSPSPSWPAKTLRRRRNSLMFLPLVKSPKSNRLCNLHKVQQAALTQWSRELWHSPS